MKKNSRLQRILTIVIILLIVSGMQYYRQVTENGKPVSTSSGVPIATLYQQQRSDVQVSGTGTVVKLLADDLKGARHQKFIVRVDKGLTVLVAHNIDVAPRIDDLRTGDEVRFYGEYDYNNQGGVIHWTHHAASGNHPDGWLKHNGRLYQ